MSKPDDHLKTRSLPSVPRALDVLEHIASSRNGLTLSEISRLLGYPRSTVHCLLLTLQRAGYIHRSGARAPYVSGEKLLELSGKALAGVSLREFAMAPLRSLSQRTKLVAHMAVLQAEQVTIIAQCAPPGVRLITWIGQRLELHCTALGKAIVGQLPEQRVSALLQSRAFTPHNEHTIVSARRFSDELAVTRQRGYAIDDEEDAVGYRCLAAPLPDNESQLYAAVSVMGSTQEITDQNVQSIANELKLTATNILDRVRAAREGATA